jgi:hypothetical protein
MNRLVFLLVRKSLYLNLLFIEGILGLYDSASVLNFSKGFVDYLFESGFYERNGEFTGLCAVLCVKLVDDLLQVMTLRKQSSNLYIKQLEIQLFRTPLWFLALIKVKLRLEFPPLIRKLVITLLSLIGIYHFRLFSEQLRRRKLLLTLFLCNLAKFL